MGQNKAGEKDTQITHLCVYSNRVKVRGRCVYVTVNCGNQALPGMPEIKGLVFPGLPEMLL